MPLHSSAHPRRLTWLFVAFLLAACGQRDPGPGLTPLATAAGVLEGATAAPTASLSAGPTAEALPAETSSAPTEPGWTVEILQNGQVVATETGGAPLARAPFTLRVTLPQALPVKLNVNADDSNFVALQPGYVFTEDCLDALCTGMDVAEERLNPTQVLFVDPMSTHYLYYQAPDDHRWSRATVDANGAVFERDVALLNDLPIDQFGGSELYLLLFVDSANPGVIDPGELKKIMLSFT